MFIDQLIGCTTEVTGIKKDGHQFPVILCVSEFSIGDESLYTMVLQDISEQKRANDAIVTAYEEMEARVDDRTRELQETNLLLRQEIVEHNRLDSELRLAMKVFQNTSEAIVITDKNANIVDVNQAFTRITQYERSEVVGRNPRVMQSGRHDVEFYRKMWSEILASSGHWSGEVWDRRKDGEIYPKWLAINCVRDECDEIVNFVAIFSDISHIKVTEEKLERLAFYDPLTGLPNRMLFRDRLNHELEICKRNDTIVAVLFIDLDRFKYVNDTYGHGVGDLLLTEVARRIEASIRAADTVARLGGDEFATIISELKTGQAASATANAIIKRIQGPFEVDGKVVSIGASIGISVYPDDAKDFSTLIKYADVAMYHAKEAGGDKFQYFQYEMNEKTVIMLALEQDMRAAIDGDEFVLHYQPKVDLSTNKIVSMESLVRWQRADGSLVSPADFIPVAEETGLIIPLGEKILRMACAQNKTWLDSGEVGPLHVAVNLSVRQFQMAGFQQMVEAVLAETGLPPSLLELEITESMMVADEGRAIRILQSLRDLGMSISIDDFGTGYSSFSYMKQFPVQALKIDQSFIRDLVTDSDDAAIVTAIVSMAKSLNLKVIAEGVETKEQYQFLGGIGCNEVQGYLISRPLPSERFFEFVKNYR